MRLFSSRHASSSSLCSSVTADCSFCAVLLIHERAPCLRERLPDGKSDDQTGLSRIEETRFALSGGKISEHGEGDSVSQSGYSAARYDIRLMHVHSDLLCAQVGVCLA